MKFYIKDFFSFLDLVAFTEEMLNRKLHFLCSASTSKVLKEVGAKILGLILVLNLVLIKPSKTKLTIAVKLLFELYYCWGLQYSFLAEGR